MPIKYYKTLPFFFFLPIISLNLNTPAQNFLIKKYSVDNGLPDNRVNDIAQDSAGRIWIATRTGIASYDGVNWTKHGKEAGIPQSEFIRIKIDEEGTIWFLPPYFSHNPIFYYKNSKWYSLMIGNEIAAQSFILKSLDVKNGNNGLEIAISTITKGVIRFKDYKWNRITRKDGILSDTVTQAIYFDNKLVIASLKGLSLLDENNEVTNITFDKYGIDSKILALRDYKSTATGANKLLLLGLNWIGELTEGRLNILSKEINLPFVGINDFYCINYNNAGDIFCGNPARVFYYNNKNDTTSVIVIDDPSSNKGINSILIDYEENIWLAGLRGIYKYRISPFKNYHKKDGLLENEVTAISEFNSGQFVFGHNYGISIMSNDRIKTISFAKPSEDGRLIRVMDIYHDKKKDNIYFTSFKNGIALLSTNQKLKWYRDENIFHYFSIFGLDHTKLYLSAYGGLYVLGSFFNIHKFSPNLDILIRKGLFVNDSLFFLATSKGLIKWESGKITEYLTDNTDADDLFSIYNDNQYGLLIGSVRGLYRLENDKLVKFNFDDNQINESIYFIIKDKKQNIWLGTNNGVLRWDGSKLTRFNKADGLSGNETNRAAGFVDSKGNVWIGTDEGLSLFVGNETDYSEMKPRLFLLDIQDDNNNSFSPYKALAFSPNNNTLTFRYRGLSFIEESQNVYEVQLSKLNSNWSEKFATIYPYSKFINLSPGDYRFSVRYKNSKGFWSEWKQSAVITIDKHFYQQPFFIFSTLLILLFLLYHLYDFVQQKKYTIKLEKAVQSRTAELKKKQTELITSIKRYKGIVDSQTDLVIRVDPNGNFTFVNDAFCNLFGKSRESLIGTSLFTFIHPDDYYRAIEEAKKLEYPPHRIKIELRASTINGIRWYSWEDYAFFDENKKLIEVQGVGRDITIQKEIETELEKRVRERTSELQSLIQQSPLGILIFNSDGYLINFNESANKLFGNLNDYLQPDKSFNIFQDEFLLQNNYQNRLRELLSGNSQLITNRIHINNSVNTLYANLYSHYLIYRLYSVGFENQKNIIVLLLEDVTDLQKSEENAKKLSEEKLRITTINKTIEAERERITKELHDGVGQMLTAAKLKLDIFSLKTDADKKGINETIDILIGAGDEIRRIINDLKPSDVENFGLVSSIKMICKKIQEISEIKMHCNVQSSIQLKNKADEVIVYRIIQEALNNIIKHSNCKNAGIDLIQNGKLVKINIWDDGIGFSEVDYNNQSLGFGIKNMISRAKLLNAQINFASSKNGASINIKIPVE